MELKEPRTYKDVTYKEQRLVYKNSIITVREKYLTVLVISTGSNFSFNISTKPTSNCQLMSVGGMNILVSNVLASAVYFTLEGEKKVYTPTLLQKLEIFYEVIKEIKDAVNTYLSENFKILLIDINQSYKKYFESDYLNLSEECYLLKHDYTSTRGTFMYLIMLKMDQVLINLQHTINNEKAKSVLQPST